MVPIGSCIRQHRAAQNRLLASRHVRFPPYRFPKKECLVVVHGLARTLDAARVGPAVPGHHGISATQGANAIYSQVEKCRKVMALSSQVKQFLARLTRADGGLWSGHGPPERPDHRSGQWHATARGSRAPRRRAALPRAPDRRDRPPAPRRRPRSASPG